MGIPPFVPVNSEFYDSHRNYLKGTGNFVSSSGSHGFVPSQGGVDEKDEMRLSGESDIAAIQAFIPQGSTGFVPNF